MKQKVYLEPGAIRYLKDVLDELSPQRIFLVTGKSSYTSSGAEVALAPLLQDYRITRFYDFEQNPKIEDVEVGLEMFRENNYDLIIAVGGGSVLDVAKLIRIFDAQDSAPLGIITRKEKIQNKGIPLIVIPTTAGSGSEATHFAVVYVDRTKYSVAHEYVLPEIAIVESTLTHSMPPKLTAVTGMDALSQAIESFWSVNSTDESKTFARQAIPLVMKNLEKAVRHPSLETRFAMAKASHLAGQAINISKTTAPHAISYVLTSYFGIPHGQAVGLTLGDFIIYNSKVDSKTLVDNRGVLFVQESMAELCKCLGAQTPIKAAMRIEGLLENIGLATRFDKLAIQGKDVAEFVINEVNMERLSNNPRGVSQEFLASLFDYKAYTVE
jgi:alcohol dehydrogenase class IV